MGTNIGEELMGRMADLDAELHELPDNAKDFMEGFQRGRAEGLIIGQEEGAVMERERLIRLFEGSDSAVAAWAIAIINGENN
jgi:hypothetical protein